MQLDIFEHARDVMLLNDVAAALWAHDMETAAARARLLEDEFPRHDALPAIGTLLRASRQVVQATARPFADHAVAGQAVAELSEGAAAAAQRLFAQRAAGWLEHHWALLATAAEPLPLAPREQVPHAAPLWLKASRFAQARRAVERIPSWRRLPPALAWMTEAVWSQDGLASAWPLIFELAWLHGDRLPEIAQRVGDRDFNRIMAAFDGAELGAPAVATEEGADASEYAWLPAFALIDKAAPAAAMRAAGQVDGGPAERAARLVADLLHMERSGQQKPLIDARRALRDLHPALFAYYMRTR